MYSKIAISSKTGTTISCYCAEGNPLLLALFHKIKKIVESPLQIILQKIVIFVK